MACAATRVSRFITKTLCVALLTFSACAAAATQCDKTGPVLQILGSGGPIADDGRASTAYIIWVAGQSKILIDVGGGAFLRFGEAGADFAELDHIAISHFHTDHSADLVTLLKTGYFSDRTRPLGISGPDAGGPFPGLPNFLASTIGNEGAYAYLSGYLDGSDGLVQLQLFTLDAARRDVVPVLGNKESRVQIQATGVPHGIVPTIAYRVRIDDSVVVFASDQNGNDEAFVDFARDADVLVMHMAVPENISGAGRNLHAPPSVIGKIAAAANARKLVLSHFMARSLKHFDANIEIIRDHYNGEIVAASDLQCLDIRN